MQLTKRQWIAVALLGAAILALGVAVKACVEKPDPYRLEYDKDQGLEIVVPQD